jgi:hypothetical protein
MMGNKKELFVTLVDCVPRFEAYMHVLEASFSPSSIDSLCLRVAQVSRSGDIWRFLCPQIDRRTDRLLYPFAAHVRMRGN